jgi:monooxygenase
MTLEHFDVLIVGAGLSGIGAGYHLQTRCRDRRYAILEGRDAIGGTWDLFRYPGIRSDSDMYTLGYSFRPWEQANAIADGPSILEYVRDTAREHGIDRRIRFGHQVKRASWSSQDARWTVEAERGSAKEAVRFTCNFLFACGGYYKYSEGYTPDFPGVERFAGRIVHPQKWTDDIDYAGKRVIVIGSGATAVTLVPELAKKAAHVTMLQRSPTWVVARPAKDEGAIKLRKWLPPMLAYGITRWKRVLLQQYFFNLCRRSPARARRLLLGGCAPISVPTTTSSGTSRRATTPGSSGCAWCPTRTFSLRSAAGRRRWSPTGSRPSPRPASGSPRARSSRPT